MFTTVSKTPNPGHIPEKTTTPVTYTVVVSVSANTSTSVMVTSLSDNLYGIITTTGHNGITATDCTVPQTIASGSSYTCHFTVAEVAGEPGQSITDTVCAIGTDGSGKPLKDSQGNSPPCGPAIVTIDDVLPTATLIKTVQSANCAQVQYQVQVVNTDLVDPLTLNALCDNTFGDLSAGHNSSPACSGAPKAVVSTTCAVPQTLQPGDGQPGGGTCPGGPGCDTYICTFVGLACVGDTDIVTGTLHDDEGDLVTPSGSATLTGVTVTGTHSP